LNIHLHRRAHLRGDRRYGRPEHSQPSSIEWPGATGSVLGASGRGHRRSSAMVDHKNRHPSQDCRARLPDRHRKRALERTILPGQERHGRDRDPGLPAPAGGLTSGGRQRAVTSDMARHIRALCLTQ
jgi:hypothetical protein